MLVLGVFNFEAVDYLYGIDDSNVNVFIDTKKFAVYISTNSLITFIFISKTTEKTEVKIPQLKVQGNLNSFFLLGRNFKVNDKF